MKRDAGAIWYALILLAATAVNQQEVSAQALWQRLIPGRQVQANPNQDYVLTEDHGPWIILATTFSGDGAEDQARDLVLELRRRYKLHSYMYSKTFDFTGTVDGRGVDAQGQPLKMRHRRDIKLREIAVVVGNYPEIDDTQLQRDLKHIKYMQPDALDVENRERTNQSLAGWRTLRQRMLPDGHEDKQKGPMKGAFATRNPLLPKEFFVPPGLDPLVEKMNRHQKYSLLDNPGKFTVQVATFTGKSVLDQEQVKQYEYGEKRFESKLAQAAERAENLTFALRQKGYEAYSFHDRSASIVTIGSFAEVGAPRLDGKTEINPDIHKIIQAFSAESVDTGALPQARQNKTAYKVKEIIGIPFDLQPKLVHVPKRSVSSRVARGRPENY